VLLHLVGPFDLLDGFAEPAVLKQGATSFSDSPGDYPLLPLKERCGEWLWLKAGVKSLPDL
jgi:hypothetical protein